MTVSESEQMDILISGFSSQEKEYRATCVKNLIPYGSKAVPTLIQKLHDPDWKVRYRAAEALGMIRDARAIPALITSCSDEKDHVRYMAAKGLGLIRNTDGVPVLIRLLSDGHSYTRGIASEALAFIQDPRAKLPLTTALARETDPAVRDRICHSLLLLDD
jgi:HEAT repeat protein